MTGRQPTAGTREIAQGRPLDDGLEELDAEVVEDLDVDEDAAGVRGGTTWQCPTSH